MISDSTRIEARLKIEDACFEKGYDPEMLEFLTEFIIENVDMPRIVYTRSFDEDEEVPAGVSASIPQPIVSYMLETGEVVFHNGADAALKGR